VLIKENDSNRIREEDVVPVGRLPGVEKGNIVLPFF
jgi:hypothetical protein